MAPRHLLHSALLILFLASLASASGVTWEKSLKEARGRSAKTKRPLVIDFWASWCGWCRKQDHDIFQTDRFGKFSRGQIYLKLNTEDRSSGEKLARKMGISSLPTIVVLDPSGEEMDRILGYLPLERFVATLQAILDGKSEFQRLRNAKDAGSKDLLRLASMQLERGDLEAAEASFKRILVRDPGNKQGYSDDARYFLGRLELASGDRDAAADHFRSYAKDYPKGTAIDSVRRLLDQIESLPSSRVRTEPPGRARDTGVPDKRPGS